MSSVTELHQPTSIATGSRIPRDLLERALALVAHDLVAAEAELERLLACDLAIIPRVGGHIAFAGGKRFRPLLSLLCAQAAGYAEPARVTVAASAELLHTATLLHDDVVDGGSFRRGRPAARLAFGNGMAVLTGDYCLARALQAVARLGSMAAVTSLSDTVTRMAEGEVAQLEIAGDFSLDRARYYDVIERKTATLLAWCSSVAQLVDPRYVPALERFGAELGYAFQIADDLLDYRTQGRTQGRTHGLAHELDKEPGQDLREGKMTLPLILACETDPQLRTRVRDLLDRGPPLLPEHVAGIVERVHQIGAAARAHEVALAHVDASLDALAVLPPSAAKQALIEVAHYVVQRTH